MALGRPISQPGKRASLLHVISRENCLGYRASPATGPGRLHVICDIHPAVDQRKPSLLANNIPYIVVTPTL